MPGRGVGDVVTDVQAVLDALKIGSFFCAGQSGGGPHALACAALLPDRVLATASLAGVAPWGADGLDWLGGMGPENLEEFGAALKGREAIEAYLDREAAVIRDVRPEDVAASLGGLVSDVDKAALTGAYAEFMASVLGRAVSTGIAGWRDDDIAFTRPWGFDLGSIENSRGRLAGRRGPHGPHVTWRVARRPHPAGRRASPPRRRPSLPRTQ